jgi:hypothetical protein
LKPTSGESFQNLSRLLSTRGSWLDPDQVLLHSQQLIWRKSVSISKIGGLNEKKRLLPKPDQIRAGLGEYKLYSSNNPSGQVKLAMSIAGCLKPIKPTTLSPTKTQLKVNTMMSPRKILRQK